MLARHSVPYIPLRTPLNVLSRSVSSKAAVERKHITLSFVVPPSVKAGSYDFESVEQIEDFIKVAKCDREGPQPP